MGNADSDGGDVIALDEDFAGRNEFAALYLEEVSSVEDDGRRRVGVSGLGDEW